MNNTHRYGFRWARGYNSGPMPEPVRVHIATAQNDVDDASASIHIHPGDPIKRVNTGGGIVALTTNAVMWICVGVDRFYDATAGCMKIGDHYPNQTAWGTNEERRGYILCVPAKSGYWEIDATHSASSPTTLSTSYDTLAEWRAAIHLNASHVVPGSAATGYGYASSADPYLDMSTVNTTHNLGWRIMDVSPTAENQDYAGAFVKLIVACNLSEEPASPTTMVAGL